MILKRNSDKYTLDEVKEKIKLEHSNIIVLSSEYFGNKKPLKLQCLKDGYVWSARLNNLMSGWGCPKCSGKIKYTLESFIEKMKKVNPNIKVIDPHYIGTHHKIQVKCLNCQIEWKVKPNKLLTGRGCQHCYRKMEPHIRNLLKLHLGYLPQRKNIKNIEIKNELGDTIRKSVIIDFYFKHNDTQYFMEYNGLQHYQAVKYFGGIELGKIKFQNQLIRDKWVYDYCKENNIELVVVDGRIYNTYNKLEKFINMFFRGLNE